MNIDKERLRIAIAEKIGWKLKQAGRMGSLWLGPDGSLSAPPDYCNALDAAWQLVEWMQDEGNLAPIITPLGKGATVQLHLNGEVVSAEAPALAICIAFCRANSIPIPQLTTT